MAKTKADLIQEAEDAGLNLTGDETVAELKILLEEDGEPVAAEDGLDESPEVPTEPAVVPVLGEHILLEVAHGHHQTVDAPAGWATERPRRLTLNGVNYEHVHDDPSGVWIYRRM